MTTAEFEVVRQGKRYGGYHWELRQGGKMICHAMTPLWILRHVLVNKYGLSDEVHEWLAQHYHEWSQLEPGNRWQREVTDDND